MRVARSPYLKAIFRQLASAFTMLSEEGKTVGKVAGTRSEGEGMALALINALPESGPIFAYNAIFEAEVLAFISDRVRSLAGALQGLARRLIDLLPITPPRITTGICRGRFQSKNVVPAIAKAMSYDELGEVQGGGGAQLAFLELCNPDVSGGGRHLCEVRCSSMRAQHVVDGGAQAVSVWRGPGDCAITICGGSHRQVLYLSGERA